MKYASLLLAVIVIGRSNSHDYSQLNLDNKVKQLSGERIVAGQLVMTDSLNLEERLGIMNGSSMRADADFIYINDLNELKIHAIEKISLTSREIISPGRGQGPREVSGIGSFTVSDSFILINDSRQMKIQVWSKSGEFITEFMTDGVRPHRVVASGDENLTLLSPIPSQSFNLFHMIDMNGNHIQSFGEPDEDFRNPLKYAGEIWTDEEFLYYAGYSEHILTKFDMDGNLIYSRSAIDDFSAEKNYFMDGDADNRRIGYVEGGYYSAGGGTIFEDMILIVHVGESPSDTKTHSLDFYRKTDGEYIATVILPLRPVMSIAVDESNIYVLTEEEGIRFIAVFENNLNALIGEL